MAPRFTLTVLAAAIALAGCATEQLNQGPSETLDARSRSTLRAGGTLLESNSVTLVDKVVLPMVPVKEEAPRSWLASKRVRLVNEKRRQLSLTEVVKMFFDQGINISSSIPLDGYTYAGLGVQDADAEVALRSILGAVGLDYEVDDASRSVLIRPMSSRSWKINLGDRKTTFVASGNSNSVTSPDSLQGQVGAQQGAAGGTGQSGPGGAGQQGQGGAAQGQSNQSSSTSIGGGAATSAAGGATITHNDDFWASLRAELKDRMEVLLPGVAPSASVDPSAQMIPAGTGGPLPMPTPMPTPLGGPQSPAGPQVQSGQAVDFFVKKRIGTFAVNPVTGYVTVQAPRWLLNDLDKYIGRIQAENNYLITFVGEMVLVTTNKSNSEGLDISSFATFAHKRYGVAYSNNALGGVTVNFPTGNIPSVSAGGQAVANTLLGIRSPLDGLQVFNAYLENFGTVNVVQKPIVATSNGVPGYFSRTSRKYFVQYNQTAAAGNTGAATVGTQNQLIPFDFGTTLTILPRYDSEKDLVRADIILDQVVQAGTQSIPQQVSSGSGIQQVNQDIPLAAKFGYRGEVPLRDGDLIVIGGQTEDEVNSSDGGVTGLKNSPLSAVFGQKSKTNTTGTYYFALRVKLTKRD